MFWWTISPINWYSNLALDMLIYLWGNSASRLLFSLDYLWIIWIILISEFFRDGTNTRPKFLEPGEVDFLALV